MQPKVSILVPIYNMERYLRQCLDSLIGQTLREIEIVCIDDGSTDSSPRIIDEYASRDPRITVISKTNSGYGDSMNQGLRAATGEYIGICEPDDFVDISMFEKLLSVSCPDDRAVDIVKAAYTRVTNADSEAEEMLPCWYLHHINPPHQPFILAEEPDFLLYHPSIWTCIYRREFLIDSQIVFEPIPGAGWADNPFFLETLVRAESIVYHDEALYFYREFEDGTISHLKDWHIIVDRYLEMDRFIREEHIDDPGILEGHYNRGCCYIEMLDCDFGDQGSEVQEGIGKIADCIDYDAVYDSMKILQEFKFAYQRHVPVMQRFAHRVSRGRRDSRALREYLCTYRNSEPGGNPPKVSVLVPIYNVERYLEQCLDSLTGQTLRDIQIICIDDGSIDSSSRIIDEYASRDPRILVISKTNSGYGASMNRGLEAATGEYIGICEPDDFADTHMFEEYFKAADRFQCDLVKSNYFEHSGQRDDRFIRVFDGFLYGHPFDPEDQMPVIRVRPIIWSALYRRSMIIESGIRFNETPGASFQDTSFVHKCWICSKQAVLLKGGYLHYRIDNQAASSKSESKVFAVSGEYESTFSFLRSRGEREYGLFAPMLVATRNDAYKWNYDRISAAHHPEFAKRWSDELHEAQDSGILDLRLYDDCDRAQIEMLMSDPEAFCVAYPDELPYA